MNNKQNHICFSRVANRTFALLVFLMGLHSVFALESKSAQKDSMIAQTIQALAHSPENALFLAQELYDEDSTDKQAVYLLAKAYSVNGNNALSDFYNEQLLLKDSLYLPSLILKAEHLLTANDLPEANQVITLINQHFPQSASEHYLNARYALTQNLLDAAEKEAALALQTDSSLLDAHLVLASVAMRQNKYEEAIAHFQKAELLVVQSAEQLNNYGVCLLEIGKYAEAVAILQQATDKSDNVKLAYNLGLALFQNKQYVAAREQFSNAALQTDSMSLYFIAKCYEKENRLEDALKTYQQLKATNKNASVTREIYLLKASIFISQNWYYLLAAVFFAVILLIARKKRK